MAMLGSFAVCQQMMPGGGSIHQTPAVTAEGGNKMSEIRVKDGESLESALRRFKRSTARSGVLAEARKREAYEKPSVKRKKKSEAARKRKYK